MGAYECETCFLMRKSDGEVFVVKELVETAAGVKVKLRDGDEVIMIKKRDVDNYEVIGGNGNV